MTAFLQNKDRTYSSQEVDVKLADGTVVKAQAATGGWMGATKQRPYPDFEEVPPEGRISRQDLYMGMARLYARRSTCLRGHVGCVAVKDNRIICAGYNGAPAGMPECIDVGCGGGVWEDGSPVSDQAAQVSLTRDPRISFPDGCTRAIHAEANLVAFAARHGISLMGATVFNTHGPCLPCAKLLVASQIAELWYETPYWRMKEGLELVDKANIKIVRYGAEDS